MSSLSVTDTHSDRIGGYSYESERQSREPYKQAQAALQAMPLVVLTDERTAGGSTWLLATLRAHGNTYTMGTATSTSATVLQQLNAYDGSKGMFELPRGYLYADGGEALHGNGIAPDVPMPSEQAISGEPPSWLQAALTTHEARLRRPRLTPAVAPAQAARPGSALAP